MRQVRITRPAFVNASYCNAGEVISITDATALAPFMKLIEPAPPVAPKAAVAPVTPAAPSPPQNHEVSVRYDEIARTIAITIDGVVTKLDHTELKLRME